MAHKYMVYTRNEQGLVTRSHQTRTLSDVGDYNQRERLLGWPEPYVFWSVLDNGHAVGIAPMSERVLNKMKNYSSIPSRATSAPQ